MTDEAEVERLLIILLETSQSPEQLCSDQPGLLPAVRGRLRQCRQLKQQLQSIFPPSEEHKQHFRRTPIGGLPTIAGYEIELTLGRGGMGVVYRARQLNLDRPVALKMLLAGVCATPAELTRFMREARAIAALRHTNIVQVYDINDCDGRAYFTMELIEGGTLARKLNGIPQGARPAAEMMSTLAMSIDFAHRSGVLHRDLKPGNILLSEHGILKIADFGLARCVLVDEQLTLSDVPIGTPSYMSPEQALGKHWMVSQLSDIYSLGAILYEMLTGRPPFLAESALETQRLVVSEDPVPPSKLNRKVPRDLQTICLKCLQKEPGRRYSSAGALAADLDRFVRGEPIHARPIGAAERARKWARRRPAVATGAVAAVLISAVCLGMAMWLQLQRQQHAAAAENNLRNMTSFALQGQWSEAGSELQQAEARVSLGTGASLGNEIHRARSDLSLVMRLDEIRMSRVSGGNLDYYRVQADKNYRLAFQGAGLAKAGDPAEEAAQRISISAVRMALLAALDDWCVATPSAAQRRWLLHISQRLASDQGWRERLNDQGAWTGKQNLTQLAEQIPVGKDSITLLLGLGERTRSADHGVPAYLAQIQRHYPADFWANLVLGNALLQSDPIAAEGYCRAALALRPNAAVSYDAVGDALRCQRRYEEAIGYYTTTLSIQPAYPRGISNLAGALAGLGRSAEAVAHFRQALQLDPNYAWARYGLANTLRDANQLPEAIEEYRLFIQSQGPNPDVRNSLRQAQIRQGQIDQVWTDWQQLLRTKPKDHNVWSGAAELALYRGDQSSYQRICAQLLKQFSEQPSIAAEVARSCLLLPRSPDELGKLAGIAAQAAMPSPANGSQNRFIAKFAGGLAQYRLQNWNAAIALLSGESDRPLQICNRLVIAMALAKKHEPSEAHQVLSDAIASYDWSPNRADQRDRWICHILRREAEAVVLPPTPASP